MMRNASFFRLKPRRTGKKVESYASKKLREIHISRNFELKTKLMNLISQRGRLGQVYPVFFTHKIQE